MADKLEEDDIALTATVKMVRLVLLVSPFIVVTLVSAFIVVTLAVVRVSRRQHGPPGRVPN